MKTIITLTDTTPGEFLATVQYEGEGGFDERSLSHLHGAHLMHCLSEKATAEGAEEIYGNAPSQHAAQTEDAEV